MWANTLGFDSYRIKAPTDRYTFDRCEYVWKIQPVIDKAQTVRFRSMAMATPTSQPNQTEININNVAGCSTDQPQAAVVVGASEPQIQKDATSEKNQPRKRKSTVSKSPVWEHFKKITDEDGRVTRASCLYCAKIFLCHSKFNGTSSLRAHMLACLKNPHSKDLRQKLLTLNPVKENIEGGDGMGTLGTWKFSQDDVRQAIVFMIIVDELPFKFVEGAGFKRLIQIACPKFNMLSRWSVTRDCYQLYLNEKLKLGDFLKNHSQRVCLTTDCWTSIQRINYMCITVHFIDDQWKLHKRILSFIPISCHRGEYIAISLENCLLKWGLKNIFTITVDNASSNNTTLAHFKKKLMSWGTSVAKCDYLHMRCISHILNLVVNEGLKDINSSVKKVRECVKYIRNSPSRLRKFKEYAAFVQIETKKSLCLDVPTHWNSTYLMLNVACMYEKAFDKYDEQESSFRADLNEIPDIMDWSCIAKFSECLSYFYEATLRISGSLYVTSNSHFQEVSDLCLILNDMIGSHDVEIRQLGLSMKSKFDSYWGDPHKMNKLIFTACVFDPSAKFEQLKFSLITVFGKENAEILYERIKLELNNLFEEYRSKYEGGSIIHNPATQSESENVSQSAIVPQSADVTSVPKSRFKARFKQHRIEMGSSVIKKNRIRGIYG
ncbi:zinc finger BED domain-containing protein RICESLEEPER 2-like [Mercurialis annua]|uniref:zinc finger BED domain-containing protein RICESLEEPER 2-like n=1 Tax=Mercurialis annua TaxID=3986 RepID=UPI00215DD568|nr:zinc finger BED domain-containing protein RICESLEEPER 2-like [Mercurialis annua]